MTDYEKAIDSYLRFPDRSDFVPVDEDGLKFLFADDNGLVKARFLAFSLGLNPSFEQVSRERVFEILEHLGGEVSDEFESDEETLEDDETANILSASYDDAPIIKLVNQLMIQAVKKGASDIHFEGMDNSFAVRLRVDGKLKTVKKFPKKIQDPIIARIKVVSNLDVAESRKPQDGRINLKIGNRTIDVRVSTVPSVTGEKAVLRILERSKSLVTLENVGLADHLLDLYRRNLNKPNGIILVTGPTGSGKTTTLYASLLEIASDDSNIMTIEDPVEYHMENITQVQVNQAVNVTFASAIRSFLRQDPDVILVGEIRDEETAEAAVQASLTGHLVLSTLHTNDAPTAVARLIDMDVEPFLISSSLLCTMGQRLVRRICPECRRKVKSDDYVRDYFQGEGYELDEHYIGEGCDACFGTGYKGRTGIFEIMSVNDEIRSLINRRASSGELAATAKNNGYKRMFDYGAELVRHGVTTPMELITVTRID
ncbi:GspE/PulE family protein [Limisalsivibrio acetivorans]|uniref:GspE/PulE family protein n=1 Tax=Limisalsivibrio acetivorans TaxID=1304888 RepID=UPI0003B3F5CC|nr:GspE/PulE family protein [Limisalsivibrio acetivorans]